MALELVQLAPGDPYAHYRSGLILQRLARYPEAMRRFELAWELGRSDEQIRQAAREAAEALEGLQIQQILSLASADPVFRLELQRNPDESLAERGFALSDMGKTMLLSLDLEAPLGRDVGPETVH